MAQVVVIAPSGGTALPDALTLVPHDVQVRRADGRSALGLAVWENADVVIVDARTDPVAARDLCVRVRAEADTSVLLLLGTNSLAVVQRSWGADDFVLENADPSEFDARIRLLVSTGAQSSQIVSGPVVIDEAAYTADVGGTRLNLTYTEFELLKYLASHPGRVLSREQLLTEVWGYDYFGGTRTVDVHVRRLRAKLGAEHDHLITTVRNVGYRFTPQREA